MIDDQITSHAYLRTRLCALMFLVFSPLGAFLPLLALHLQELRFSPFEVAWIFASQAIGGLLAPFLAGQIADRWISAERWLAWCGFMTGALLWVVADCREPGWFFGLMLMVWLIGGPSLTLASAICFAHLPHPERQFGGVRVWGTIGWIIQGILLSYWLSNPEWLSALRTWLHPDTGTAELADQFRIAGLLSVLLGAYSLTLPRTKPSRLDPTPAPLKALGLLRDRSFALFFLCHFGLCVTFPFSIQNTPLLLNSLGVPKDRLSLVLTIAQSTEVLALFGLQWILARLGMRRTILIGMCAWSAALIALMIGQPTEFVVSSLTMHGIFITCFLITGQVLINGRASADIRASAQSMVTFSSGLGILSGHFLAGAVREEMGGALMPTFAVAVGLACTLTLLFAVRFRLPPKGAGAEEGAILPPVEDTSRIQG